MPSAMASATDAPVVSDTKPAQLVKSAVFSIHRIGSHDAAWRPLSPGDSRIASNGIFGTRFDGSNAFTDVLALASGVLYLTWWVRSKKGALSSCCPSHAGIERL